MPRLACLGDPGTHGGAIVTASPDTEAGPEGGEMPSARLGDIYACPLHGPNPIVTGSSRLEINSRPATRDGDMAECGALIIAATSLSEDE